MKYFESFIILLYIYIYNRDRKNIILFENKHISNLDILR